MYCKTFCIFGDKKLTIKRVLQGRHNVYCSPYKGIKTHIAQQQQQQQKNIRKKT